MNFWEISKTTQLTFFLSNNSLKIFEEFDKKQHENVGKTFIVVLRGYEKSRSEQKKANLLKDGDAKSQVYRAYR